MTENPICTGSLIAIPASPSSCEGSKQCTVIRARCIHGVAGPCSPRPKDPSLILPESAAGEDPFLCLSQLQKYECAKVRVNMTQQAHNERPYRSHLRPACLACRRRKSRCQSEPSSETCLMCRAHCTDCVFPSGPNGSNRTPDSARRRRQTRSTGGGATPTRRCQNPVSGAGSDNSVLGHPPPDILSAPNAPNKSPPRLEWATQGQETLEEDESPLALGSADDQQHNLHIVGPAVTSDNQVLSDYLSAMPGATRGSRLVIPVPGNRSQPVLFTMVQKRPLGLTVNRSTSAAKLEMIVKMLEPYEADVIDV
ncbi:hypothetical protein AUP68_05954 [Ilyonectria robusta]